MTNPNKAKGSQFELDVARYFNSKGALWNAVEVERRYGAGATLDKGDISGLRDTVAECKNLAKITLASIVDEALKEQANAKKRFGISIIKRRNRNVKDSYVVMTLEQYVDLYCFFKDSP